MEYAAILWDGYTESESDLLGHVQYEVAKIVTGAMKGTSKHRTMQEIEWEDLKTIRAIHKLRSYFKIVNNLCLGYQLVDLCEKRNKTTPYERHQTTLFSPATLSVLKDLSFPLLLPCGMTLVLTYVVSNPLVLLFSFYNVPSYNATYDFAIDRFNAIFHTRSRLDTCALNYYLFKVGCKESPVCFCGFHN